MPLAHLSNRTSRLLLPFGLQNTSAIITASPNAIKPSSKSSTMPFNYYFSGEFLYNSTTNVFNFIALISAILLILDPLLFIAHTGYNFYLSRKVASPAAEKPKGRPRAASASQHHHATPSWWKWYVVAASIHLLDAWFFRSIVPFFERARASKGVPHPDDLQDLADISRLLWGILRALSIFVIGLEVWENRLNLTKTLGQNYKNPKWGFAASCFLAPTIVVVSAVPVVGYWVLWAGWNSLGFLTGVVTQALKPDWRRTQDVFVKTATEVVTALPTSETNPKWKFWGVVPGA